jgi:hypothetical protein
MSKTCSICGTTADDETKTYCDECGADFGTPNSSPSPEAATATPPVMGSRSEPDPSMAGAGGDELDEHFEPDQPSPTTSSSADVARPAVGAPARAGSNWRLIPKQSGSLLDDQAISLTGVRLLIGRYDESTGPVDVDLTDLPGGDTVSRSHAILDYVDGQWYLSDAGSANGLFVRRAGEDRFSGQIVERTALNDGDEIGCGRAILLVRQS